ncbi:integrase [Clavibacter michiganensis subsp. michiganensis]|nr:integrase [Clavibacter michiganensis subsp. michiganensis]
MHTNVPKRLNHRLSLVSNSGMKNEIVTPALWVPLLLAFTAWLRSAGRPDTTLYLRGYHLRRFASTSKLAPAEVTMEALVDYMSDQTWSLSTRRSHRSSFRSFFAWAHLAGHLPADPAAALPQVQSVLGRPRPAPETVVKHGMHRADPRVRLMVQLGAQAGLRCCEIAVVHSDDLVQDMLGWSLRAHGKGNKVRLVPLSERLALTLRTLPPGYAFPGRIDGHLSSSYVSKLVSEALPEGWTAHTLRHRFASVAYSADRDIRAVQELLGHASVATTQIYTAIPSNALRRAVDAAA